LNRPALLNREFRTAFFKSPLVAGALIFLATMLAYLPATRCGYIWDDDVYVTQNELLSAPDGLCRIWFSLDSPSQYFPLVYTTFRVERALWGLNPAGYHWVNILLHIANALLVWRLMLRLNVPGAWLAAMIFALHPVQVESVAWITERKNVLMLSFFLLAVLSWTSFIDTSARQRWKFYALALIFHALALFSKTTACTLPAALLLILWLRHRPVDFRRLAQIVPFLALGLGMGLLTVWWERYHQGTQGKLFALTLPERMLTASHALWFYAGKLIWPANLAFSYARWTPHPWNPLAWGWLAALIALCWMIYCAREDLGRGPEVAALFFATTLSPVLGFIMLYTFRYSFVADHYQYAASIGPIALFAAGMAGAARHCGEHRRAIHLSTVFILLLLGALTWRQCRVYQNAVSIWRDTLAKNPGSLMAHYNIGNELMRNGNLADAIDHYSHAIDIDPGFTEARCNRAQALALKGLPAYAAADYSKVVKQDPGNSIAQTALADLLRKMGKPGDAIPHYQEAVRAQPQYALARKHLADTLAAQGRFADALPHFEEIARQFPTAPQSHVILARTWLELHKPADAIREYREAVRLAPQSAEPLARLAWLLLTTRDPHLLNDAEAAQLAERACDLTQYNNVFGLSTLAAARAAQGRFADATAYCLDALELAQRAGQKDQAATIQRQLDNYQSGRIMPPTPASP
jgi:tetratricopeptide (TPR) repeat protein